MLFELLNDPHCATSLRDIHGFDWRSLAVLTGRYDVYGSTDVQRLEQMDQLVRRAEIELSEARAALATSRTEIGNLVSQRDHLLQRLERITENEVYRGLAAVYRVFNKHNP